jgi:hypothetical protein
MPEQMLFDEDGARMGVAVDQEDHDALDGEACPDCGLCCLGLQTLRDGSDNEVDTLQCKHCGWLGQI